MTRKTALAFGIGASLILAAGTASADCASEVQALQQQIGVADTSTDMSASGSATMDSDTATTGTSEEGTAVNPTYSSNDPAEPAEHDEQITGSTDTTGSSEVTGSGETMTSDSSTITDESSSSTTADSGAAATGTSEEGAAVNPTYSSNDPAEPAEHDQQVTSGTTSSDIAEDASDETMASESSGAVGTGTITETTRTGEVDATTDSRTAAIASLEKAKLYADAGQEDACMSELSIAKEHMGVE